MGDRTRAAIFPPLKATGGAGVDVAIDNVGSQPFEPIRRSMGIGGR
jgi:NADPH:quinone reductase-like Zn-dependent oxidoreductase